MPSRSPAQARLMAACAHGAGYSSCPPSKISKEFNQADKGSGILSRRDGGSVDYPGFTPMPHGGFVNSEVPGRTDRHYVTVANGSYVLPADYVSALGEGNSVAGAKKIQEEHAPGTKFGPRLRIPHFARGGRSESIEPAPAVIAGGEVVLPPHIVRRYGGGNLEKGHEALDKLVMTVREKNIKRLKSLKPPVGSKK